MSVSPEGNSARPQAQDALSAHILRVRAEARPAEVVREWQSRCTTHFAVFDYDRFLGLVNPQDALHSSPQHIFADLLPRQQPGPVPPETPVADLIRAMERFDTDALPVIDRSGSFIGIATRESVFQTLLDYQRRWNATLVAEREQLVQSTARLADELRASAENYRSIVENAQEGIFQSTPEGRFLTVNPALARILGYDSPQELLASVTDIAAQIYVNPDRRAEFHRIIEEQSYVRGFEFETYHKDGNRRWVRENGRLVRDAQGNALYYEGVIEDITERKRAEQENRLLLTLTKVLIEAETFDASLTLTLWMVCESTGWDYGEVWVPTRDGTHLELGSPYYCRVREVESFHGISKEFAFAPGIGLPGRVWASRSSVWIPDVTADANFPRAPFAKEV
ncbi:MAG: PAS domain S-box protein, partial [Spirochaetota bacterium]